MDLRKGRAPHLSFLRALSPDLRQQITAGQPSAHRGVDAEYGRKLQITVTAYFLWRFPFYATSQTQSSQCSLWPSSLDVDHAYMKRGQCFCKTCGVLNKFNIQQQVRKYTLLVAPCCLPHAVRWPKRCQAALPGHQWSWAVTALGAELGNIRMV